MKKNSSGHVIAIDGGKRSPEKSTGSYINIEGDIVKLGSFVLSGETDEGKRVLLTFNCSPDELTSYAKTLDIVVSKRIEQIMEIE